MSKGKIAALVLVVLGISTIVVIFGTSQSASLFELNSQESIGVGDAEGKHFNLELKEDVNVQGTP